MTGATTETTGTTLCLLLLLLLLGSKALLTDWQHKLWGLAWCYFLTVGSTYVPTFRCLDGCGRGEVRWGPSAGCVWLSWSDLSFFRKHRSKLLQREADGPPYSRGARPRNAHAPLFCRIYADWLWMNIFSGEKLGTRPTFFRSHESFQTENIHTLPGGLFSSCEAALLEFRVHWPYIWPFILVRTLGTQSNVRFSVVSIRCSQIHCIKSH